MPPESLIPLGELCFFVKETCKCSESDVSTYVSTESMIPNKGGIIEAETIPSTGSVSKYQPKDILISNIRPYFKKIWQSDRFGTCSNDILIIRAKDSQLSDYLFALLSEDRFFEHVMLGSKGTKMPRGDKNQILTYLVNEQTIPEMLTIGKLISIINKKIIFNHEINANLDKLLVTTYNEFINSANVIYKKLKDVADVQKGLSYKGSGLTESGAHMINLGNVMPGGGYRFDKNKRYSGEYKEKHLVKPGDLIIANTDMTQDRVILGSPLIVPEYDGDIIFSHHLFAFRNVSIPKSYLYYYLRSYEFHSICESSANGTTVLAISKDDVLDAPIPIIPDVEMAKYTSIADQILDMMKCNIDENHRLSKIRDYLLPKLMSGEIDVSQLDLAD